jgi:hypothetical protein
MHVPQAVLGAKGRSCRTEMFARALRAKVAS